MNKWYDDAVFYSIYPLGAFTHERENSYGQPGGGMVELGRWKDHIISIGCNAVNLAPIFQSKTHGYDTTDYRLIDSRLGTNEQFKQLVKDFHAAGIRVVVDGVFNHTGRDFFAFQDIKKNRENSKYRGWYNGVNFGGNNPMNDGFSYEVWRGHWELPRLNPHNGDARRYLLDTALFWINEFDIDGIRLDCADQLDFGFMHDLRNTCVGAKSNFWLMGEVIHGDYNRWVNDSTLHSVTNYECSKGLYSSHNDGNMHEIAHSLTRQFSSGGIYKNHMLFNFADNHDLNRVASTVKNKKHLSTLYTVLYTMPGVPSIYYGSEWGLEGVTDRVTDWNLRPYMEINSVHMDDPQLMAHIAALSAVRLGCAPLKTGDYQQLHVASQQLAYRRKLGDDAAIVMVNISDKPELITVEAHGGKLVDILNKGESFDIGGGRATVAVPPYGSRVLVDAARYSGFEAPAFKPVETVKQPEPVPTPVSQPVEPEKVEKAVEKIKPQVESNSAVLVTRMDDIQPAHKNQHNGYEYFKRSVVNGEDARCTVSFYEIPQGKSAYPYHSHSTTDEVFYIISGSGILRTEDGERSVNAGDVMYFPAGKGSAHKLTNNSSQPLCYIDFATRSELDLAHYPDSGKIGIINSSGNQLFYERDAKGYYDGE